MLQMPHIQGRKTGNIRENLWGSSASINPWRNASPDTRSQTALHSDIPEFPPCRQKGELQRALTCLSCPATRTPQEECSPSNHGRPLAQHTLRVKVSPNPTSNPQVLLHSTGHSLSRSFWKHFEAKSHFFKMSLDTCFHSVSPGNDIYCQKSASCRSELLT